MNHSFWQGKKVLVTGAGGFIGAALTHELLRLGASVVGISKSAKKVGLVAADVASKRQMETFLSGGDLFACFHLAGQALVEHGRESPYTTFKTNILGTLNILELCKLYRVPKIVIASTVQVYGDAPAPVAEDIFPRPSRPYETSKTCADLVAQSYADSYGLPVLIPRFVNIYGPSDMNFSRLIPKTIRSILAGRPPTLWGGGVIRDFLYIDDAVRAFLMIAEQERAVRHTNRIFNFGTGEAVTVREIAEMIIRLSGVNLQIVHEDDERDQEIPAQYVAWEKARQIFGWEPRVAREAGLRKTIEWYRDHAAQL